MIRVTVKGSFRNTDRFLARMKNDAHLKALSKFGPMGVAALRNATPKASSETANAWTYVITQKPGYYAIAWHNSHVVNGTPVAVLLQYGHGTRNGGHVQGRDYINPAIRPIFDQIVADMWKEVTK